MNKIAITLNSILIIAVAILAFQIVNIKKQISGESPKTEGDVKIATPKIFTDPSKIPAGKVAYINIDSINTKYQYIIDNTKALNSQIGAIENQIANLQAKGQQQLADFQQAQQAGIRPEAELMKMAEEIKLTEQNMYQKQADYQAMEEKAAKYQASMIDNITAFIKKYNNNKFDYILAYSSKSTVAVLYANPELEITTEILNGLNLEYAEKQKVSKK